MPFLADGLVTGDPEQNQLDLYKRILPPEWPGLFMIGFFNTDTALNMVFEHQARWVRDIIAGKVQLPSSEVMRQNVEAKAAWVHTHFKQTPRHGIEEEHVPYLAELKKAGAPTA